MTLRWFKNSALLGILVSSVCFCSDYKKTDLSSTHVVFTSDSFTGANGAAVANTDANNGGTAKPYELLMGTAKLLGNLAIADALVFGSATAVVDAGKTDCAAQFKIKGIDGTAGILVLSVRGDNALGGAATGFAFIADPNDKFGFGHGYTLVQNDGGGNVNPIDPSTAVGSPAAEQVMRVETSGNTITAFVDGIQILQGTSAFYNTQTYFGWAIVNMSGNPETTTSIDDFIIEDCQ